MSRPSLPLCEILAASSRCLADVERGRSLTEALGQTNVQARPGVQAVTSYALRHWGLAVAWRAYALMRNPNDRWLRSHIALCLLLLDAAMIAENSAPEDSWQAPLGTDCPVYGSHTLVNEAVKAVGKTKLGKPASGLVNAVLRRFQRERASFILRTKDDPVARWNHPAWWINLIRSTYPQNWQSILMADSAPPRLVLRVNPRRSSVPATAAALSGQGHEVIELGGQALLLTQSAIVEQLAGFDQGWWSVQDLGAQAAVPLLPLENGMRVLDACCAPGGKTAHILERHDVKLTALDQDQTRLARVHENLQRLGLGDKGVNLIAADARDLTSWWDGQPFDAILADVPCTASGVVRRHPDIAWLRRESDLAATVTLQRQILDALWQTLAPGGHLLLVTCSVFPQEGEQQANALLERHKDALRLPAPGQQLPKLADQESPSGRDGFFYALFQRSFNGQHASRS